MLSIDRVHSQRLFSPRVEMANISGHRMKARGGKFKGDLRGKILFYKEW